MPMAGTTFPLQSWPVPRHRGGGLPGEGLLQTPSQGRSGRKVHRFATAALDSCPGASCRAGH